MLSLLTFASSLLLSAEIRSNFDVGVNSVADHQRQGRQLPYTITVPVYIECGYMLSIQGNICIILGLAMSKVLTTVKEQLVYFSSLKVAGTRISMLGRHKGGMVETLFLGTLSWKWGVDFSHTVEKEGINTVFSGLNARTLGHRILIYGVWYVSSSLKIINQGDLCVSFVVTVMTVS